MKKTTTEGVTIISVEPFVFNPGIKFVGPVLWDLPKTMTRKPALHETTCDDDGTFRHRIVWRDHCGVYLHSTQKAVPPATIRMLHDAAVEYGAEIELLYHGSVLH
jgi:hypothetical protein